MDLSRPQQNDSALLQLPAEIRLMILRYLLCKEPLLSKKRTSASDFERSIPRSAQILRTCQLLRQEGTPILYEENTLHIDFSVNNDSKKWCCHVLDLCFEQPLICERLLEHTTLSQFLKRKRTASNRGRGPNISCFSYDYDMLTRFKHFDVTIHCNMVDHVLYACRVLRDLLLGKHVTLAVFPWSLDDDTPSRVAMLQWLEAARCLRCKDFKFRNMGKDKTRDIVEAITGNKPVYDTWMNWIYSYDVLDDLIPDGNWDLVNDYEEEISRMDLSAASYNVGAYLKKREAFFDSVLQEIQIALTAEKKEIMDEAQARIDEIDEQQIRVQDALLNLGEEKIYVVE